VRNPLNEFRRYAPEVVLVFVVVLGAISVWQAWAVIQHLRTEARQSSRIFGEITAALADASPGADTETLLTLVADIRASGLPLVVTDPAGGIVAAANIPFEPSASPDVVRAYVAQLDRTNPPIEVPGVGTLHFGALPAARRLTYLTATQLALLVTVIALGVLAYRAAVTRDRGRLWVAMARESAHQLGTPLMSAGAWVERLEEGATEPAEVAQHLRHDLERLHRVAQRFERIGRPARKDRVALGALAERVANYFQPRLPRHAHPVELTVNAPDAGPTIEADATLVEWAMEVLVRNALDALSGRGGKIEIVVDETPHHAEIRIVDDGPGISEDVRASLFEPGVTTKSGGWGIGLALARRIAVDVHHGKLDVDPLAEETTFVLRLPKVADRPDG
jgi:signal transduction histidine kinase